MTTIYLIRHSETISNKDGISNEEIPLNSNGEKKAEIIANLDEFKNIDVVYSSEYKRAISTAKYIADKNNLKINITNSLNERKLGNVDGIPDTFWLTQLEDEDAKAPNGESRKEVKERMLNFIDEVVKKCNNKKIVMVSHAAAITFLLMNWCELVSADLNTKSRHLTFNGNDVINGKFGYPEIFILEFMDNNIINIKLLRSEAHE